MGLNRRQGTNQTAIPGVAVGGMAMYHEIGIAADSISSLIITILCVAVDILAAQQLDSLIFQSESGQNHLGHRHKHHYPSGDGRKFPPSHARRPNLAAPPSHESTPFSGNHGIPPILSRGQTRRNSFPMIRS